MNFGRVMLRLLRIFLGGLLIGSLAEGHAQADEKGEAAPDFQKDVLPIFEEKCLRCHGAKRRGGKLDMRTKACSSS
jgi:hypothetical protein